MRVRPIFWCLLALSCAGVLLFAGIFHPHDPALMQVHLAQTLPESSGYQMQIELHLSDTEGTPIDQAQIRADAHMTNMDMSATHIQVLSQGNGNYRILIPLSMGGPWAIHLLASADGFDPQQRNLCTQVQ
jgi:hypothetical protein